MSAPTCNTCTGPLDERGGCAICERFARVRNARKAAIWRSYTRPRKWKPIVPKAANGQPVAAQFENALPPSDRR